MPSHSPLYDATAKALAPLSPYVPLTLLRWEHDITPLSSPYTAAGSIAFYLVTIFSLRSFLRGIKARRGDTEVPKVKGKKNASSVEVAKPREKPVIPASYLKYPFLVHNILLSAGSGWLLALMLEEVIPIWKRNGAFYSICGEGAWTMRLETFYIINYYIKYWELIDTLFLVLKEKPLAFLHVYHHSATALLCYSQLQGKTSVSWVVICLNLAVHVLMCAYGKKSRSDVLSASLTAPTLYRRLLCPYQLGYSSALEEGRHCVANRSIHH
jgi:fatty acid elongase 3